MTTAATVEMLLTAPAAGVPMVTCPEVELVPGRGIAGDRYALCLGHWSDPKWPDQELTLFEAELAEALGLAPEQLRRNVVTRGVDLASLVGREFRFGAGGPVVFGVRPCDPCTYIEGFTRPGAMRELTGIRGGLRARIITGGTVRVGDKVTLVSRVTRATA